MTHRHPPSTTIAAAATPRGLTEADAARYAGISPAYLHAARVGRCDGPPYVRYGRAVRYLRDDLDRWMESRRVGATQ